MATRTEPETDTLPAESLALDRRLSRVGRLLATPVQALSFWVAVVLPLAYVPLLAARLLSTTALLACLGVNALALLLGHPHNRGVE